MMEGRYIQDAIRKSGNARYVMSRWTSTGVRIEPERSEYVIVSELAAGSLNIYLRRVVRETNGDIREEYPALDKIIATIDCD